MWEKMRLHHHEQLKLVQDITDIDVSNALKETSDQLHGRTKQLHSMTSHWTENFNDLVTHKKRYIKSLNDWLRLSLIPIESSLTEKVSSPARPLPAPPIKKLIFSWQEQLDKLPDEHTRTTLHSFVAMVNAILAHQNEERKLKERCEELDKDFKKKRQTFEDWHQNYLTKKPPPPPEEDDPNAETGEAAVYRDLLAEKQFPVEQAKKRLEDEVEKHVMMCKQVREKSVRDLKISLVELSRAMTEFSRACSQMYKFLSDMNPPPAS